MILGPVFRVELLGLGRRKRYVLTRVVYGLILLAVMTMCYGVVFAFATDATIQLQALFARSFFHIFSWVQLFAVMGLTPAMIAGTIANEHERRTIDYLLTTSLNDSEITLGKFAARLLAIGMQLAVGLPILAIAMTLGGIDPGELAESFAVSLIALASIGALSLWISTRCRTSREAITRCYLVLVALVIVPPILSSILHQVVRAYSGSAAGDFAEWLNAPVEKLVGLDPIVMLMFTLIDPLTSSSLVELPTYSAVHLGATLGLTILSVFSLRRFYVRQSGKVAVHRRRRRIFSAPMLGDRPMWWKERVTGRSGIRLGWVGALAAGAIYLSFLWGIVYAFYESLDDSTHYSRGDRMTAIESFAIGGVPAIASLAILLITARTAGAVTAERERDTWVTLIGTPLEPREIVRAKLGAAFYAMRFWYLLIVITWVLCAVMRPALWLSLPLLAIAHVVMLVAAATFGLTCSFMSKSSLRAMGAALGILIVCGWISPLFFAGLARAEQLIPFSPPATLGILQNAAAAFASESSRLVDRELQQWTALAIFAVVCYGILALVLYRQAIDRFDELNGRIVPRADLEGKTIEPPIVLGDLETQDESQLPLEILDQPDGVGRDDHAATDDNR